MRKLMLGVSVGLAALLASAPAYAGVSYFSTKNGTLPANLVVRANFDGIDQGVFSGGVNNHGIASASSNPPATVAPVRTINSSLASGNFAYVVGGGSAGIYTIGFSPAQVFTFVFGSLNTSNTLTLNFAGTPSQTFSGGQLAGLATAASAAGQSGRFTYDAQGIGGAAGSIVSAVFSSGVGAAFEFDNIATAAPEPAAWMMMILGFGLVGGALRRSRPSRKVALA